MKKMKALVSKISKPVSKTFYNLVEYKKTQQMITKTRLREQIEHFPEEFTIDELIDRLLLIEKIERGLRQSENNEEISEKDLDKEISKWFK